MEQTYPIPLNENARQEVLRSYGILDTPPEAAFDRLTKLASRMAGAEISLVSLVDRDRQFFKSCFGTSLRETSREESFCAHAILNPSVPLIIEDATRDPRTRENGLVTGPPFIRFYAGFPIRDRMTGLPLGTLCVIDSESMTLSEAQVEGLSDVAEIVEDELELRAKKQQLQESEEKYRQLYESLQDEIEHLRQNLLQVVSHELRTPLNAVVGMTDLLKGHWENMDKEEIVELLEHMDGGSVRLTRVVERITLYAELKLQSVYGVEGSESHFEAGTCSFRKALQKATDSVDASETWAGCRARLRIEVEDVAVPIPESRLVSSLTELIDNAFKFSDPDTIIEIEGRRDNADFVVTVTDSGSGMTEEQRERIGALIQFDRDGKEQQGWGLGLAIVLQLGQIYNFSVSFDSVAGEGTKVTLRLPVD